jgi:putative transposase
MQRRPAVGRSVPRRARLRAAGIALHAIQRGNNRCACFHATEDYTYYLEQLYRFANHFACAIHAYVLMTNHVHLLLTPEDAEGASLLMKYLGQYYAQQLNRKYCRTGTLWEGRYKSCLVQSDTYVVACYRYIELNPVRAGMVGHPAEYRWSSYAANSGHISLGKLRPHQEYLALGASGMSRYTAYRALVAEGLDPTVTRAIRESTSGNVALGNARFQAEIEAMLDRRARRGIPGRPRTENIELGSCEQVPSKNVVCP